MQTTFIYALTEPSTGVIRYIGKANDPQVRIRNHIRGARTGRTDHKSNWIRKLLVQGERPKMIILEECSRDVWQERECAWIAKYKDNNVLLCNHKDGGDGLNPDSTSREKMRRAKLGKTPHNKGKKASPEVRAKMSEAAKRRAPVSSEVMRERMLKVTAASTDKSRGKPGRKKTAEEIEKISVAMRGKQNTKGLKRSPEVVAKCAEALRGHHVSEETKRKISLANSKLSEEQQREFVSMVERGDARKEIMRHFEVSSGLFYSLRRRLFGLATEMQGGNHG